MLPETGDQECDHLSDVVIRVARAPRDEITDRSKQRIGRDVGNHFVRFPRRLEQLGEDGRKTLYEANLQRSETGRVSFPHPRKAVFGAEKVHESVNSTQCCGKRGRLGGEQHRPGFRARIDFVRRTTTAFLRTSLGVDEAAWSEMEATPPEPVGHIDSK